MLGFFPLIFLTFLTYLIGHDLALALKLGLLGSIVFDLIYLCFSLVELFGIDFSTLPTKSIMDRVKIIIWIGSIFVVLPLVSVFTGYFVFLKLKEFEQNDFWVFFSLYVGLMIANVMIVFGSTLIDHRNKISSLGS